MKLINTVMLRVFIRPDEDYELIKSSFLGLVNLDLEKEKLSVKEETALGFNEVKIKILAITLEKTRHTSAFVKHLLSNLTNEDKKLLLNTINSRLDDEFNLYIRLDKDKLLDNIYKVTDSGNCFHVKLNLACYPKKHESAIKVCEKLFNE